MYGVRPIWQSTSIVRFDVCTPTVPRMWARVEVVEAGRDDRELPRGRPSRRTLERGGRKRGVAARAAELQRALRTPQLQPPTRLASGDGSSVRALVHVLGEFNAQIAALEAELAEAFENHPDAEILRSLPGLGPRRPGLGGVR